MIYIFIYLQHVQGLLPRCLVSQLMVYVSIAMLRDSTKRLHDTIHLETTLKFHLLCHASKLP